MRDVAVVVISILLWSNANAQDSISISDFRYPETRAIDWKGGLNGGTSGDYSDQSPYYQSTPIGLLQGSSSSANIDLNSSFLYFHTKDNHDQSFQISILGSYRGHRYDQNRIDSNYLYNSSSQSVTWHGETSIRWKYQHYVMNEGLQFITDFSTYYERYYLRENFDEVSNQIIVSRENFGRYYRVSFNGSLGFGYGRLRDGTVVFRGLRIIERLREDGLITQFLSREQMLQLIDRISKLREYSTNFERYSKFFIRDIIEELRSMGIISEQQLNTYSVMRVQEAFNENIYSRFFGWRVSYLFNDRHDQSQTVTNYSDDINNTWSYNHHVELNIGYPISLYSHLSSNITLDMPVRLFPTNFTLTGNISLTHQIGEKVRLEGIYRFVRTDLRFNNGVVDWTRKDMNHSFQGNFVYFIEDKISWNTRFTYNNSRLEPDGNDYFGNTIGVSRSSSFSFSFGLTYNII